MGIGSLIIAEGNAFDEFVTFKKRIPCIDQVKNKSLEKYTVTTGKVFKNGKKMIS